MKKFISIAMLFVVLVSISVFSAGAQEPVAPVPPSAYDPEVDLSNGYYVGDLGNGLYWATEGNYQLIFMTTGEGVIVVDAPPSMSGVTLEAIASVTDEPITHVIYTHSHADHIAGAGIYPQDATYIAHESTLDQLENGFTDVHGIPFGTFVGGGEVPLPTITFDDSYTLEVGSQTLELTYHGLIHEPGNIFVYAPEQKVLMLVDVIFPGWTPFSELALAEDVPMFYRAHDIVLEYDFDVFIGGHLTRSGTRADVETQQAYMTDILNNTVAAYQTIDLMAIGGEVGFDNPWVLFDTYLGALAQSCTDATVPEWVDTLGGVDIFTYSHCAAVVDSLRID